MRKSILSLVLAVLFIFTNVFQMSGTMAVSFSEPPVGTAQYNEWKQQYIENELSTSISPMNTSLSSVSANKLYNSYIELAVGSNARYTIGTLGGNPDISSDNNKKLLYGHPNPSTSYTTLRVNGVNYKYGEGTFSIAPTFDVESNKNVSEQMIGNLRVKQILSLVENTATQREDIVEVKYVIKNEGQGEISTGLRIMMDTMLGSNDAAPFRVPGVGAITYEREYSGIEVPQYWQAFDSLTYPQVVSQGTLLRQSTNKPDRVQFTNWSRVYGTPWGYMVNNNSSNGDSAVSIIWDSKTILPGEEFEYTTHYGLSEVVQDIRPPLAVSLFGDASVRVEQNEYNPNPFIVTAYIQNTGNISAQNIFASINLPDGLKILNDENPNRFIESLSGGEEKQVSWSVEIEPSNIEKTLEYSIDVMADGIDSKNIMKSITIPVLEQEYLRITDEFRYTSTSSVDRDYEATYYYDDAYFFNSSYEYNESLATMSLCLAMASGGSNEEEYLNKSNNAKKLLNEIGFSEFDTNSWFTVKPTADSIGVVAANKKINIGNNEYTLIAVGVRGFGYEQEWASNFTLGNWGKHPGFESARNGVIGFISDYVSKNNIKGEVKLWITGFSRAGATANLVAGRYNELPYLGNFGDCTLDQSDLYAYTFEAPRGAVEADLTTNPIHRNIFNIVNPSDSVPKVAPSTFGFKRYGVDKILPTAESPGESPSESPGESPAENTSIYENKRDAMLSAYNSMASTNDTPYTVDDFSMKKIDIHFDYKKNKVMFVSDDPHNNNDSQSIFLNRFITTIAKEHFKSRDNYVEEFQDDMRETFKILKGTEDEQWDEFKELFKSKLKNNMVPLIISTTDFRDKSTVELVKQYAIESLNVAGVSSFEEEQIHKLASTISKTIIGFAVNHPNLTVTLIYNLKGIGAAHHPELCLAWMQSADKNYTTNAGDVFSNGSYRIVRVNCPVDLEVYNDSNILVAEIKSDEPQNIEASSIISSINVDGEKLIYLPSNAEYSLKLIPTDSGHMTYSINEYNYEVGDINRIVNYYDLSLNKGEVFTSNIPKYSSDDLTNSTANGSNTEYSLYDFNNELIVVSEDLTGISATEAYYMINVKSNNEEDGYVMGQGVRQLGNYAQVTAIPFEDCEFLGWYANGVKVSTDLVYRFRVQEDVELEGRFKRHSIVSIKSASNGKYVCAEDGGNKSLIANRTGVGAWEEFEIINLGGNDIAIKSLANNKYVCAEDEGRRDLVANRTGIGAWETFELINNSDGTVSFKSRANNKYVCNENNGGKSLIANRTGIGAWEKFAIIPKHNSLLTNVKLNNSTMNVDENTSNGTVIGTINGQNCSNYRITGGDSSKFKIDSNTGKVTVLGTLDYESNPQYTLQISANNSNNLGNSINPDTFIYPEQYLESSNGAFYAIYQKDGNFVVYKKEQVYSDTPIWHSNTHGTSSNHAKFQDDSNFVVYSRQRAEFATNTVGKNADRLIMQDDGNLVMYRGNQAVWASNSVTSSNKHEYTREVHATLTINVNDLDNQ